MSKSPVSAFEERLRFCEYLYWRWHSKGFGKLICDFASHKMFVSTLRKKYVFPDYLELVGSAKPEHGVESAIRPRSQREAVHYLSEFRQAELLLIGAFQWRGLWIGTHQAVFGSMDESNWSDEDRGWYVAPDYKPPPRFRTAEDIVKPFRKCGAIRLEQYLLSPRRELSAREAIRFRNGNVYDCRIPNLEVYSLRGRPMLCQGCGRRIGKNQSTRVKVDGSNQRYCYEYLEWMAKAGITPRLKRCLHRM